MEYKRTATTYFIPPGKFLLLENALGNPDLIQSSVSSDCRVTIVDRENFPLDELEQWPTFRLTSADIKLKLGDGLYHIYIAVPSTDNADTSTAFVSYSAKPVDLDGYEVIHSVDEEGNPTTQKGALLGKSGFKYYSFGTVSARGENPSAITVPAGQGRYIVVDLGVNPQDSYLDKKVDWSYLNKMFVPHYDDPLNPDTLTWIEAKAHMGIAGGLTSFIDNGVLDLPSIYDGLVIDNQTIYWDVVKEEAGTDEEGNPIYKTTKVLKAQGGGSGGGVADSVHWDNIEGKPNFDDYATQDDLKDYLPLSGGTMTGKITLPVGIGTPSLDWGENGSLGGIWVSSTGIFQIIAESEFRVLTNVDGVSTRQFGISNAGNMGVTGTLLVGKGGYLTNSQFKFYVYEGDAFIDGMLAVDGNVNPNMPSMYNIGDSSKRFACVYADSVDVGGVKISLLQDGVLLIDGNLAVTGGITSYVDGGELDLPSIYDGLPIDGDTLYWVLDENGKKVMLKSKGGDEEGGGSVKFPLKWSGFREGSWDGSAEKTIEIPSKLSELVNDGKFFADGGWIGSFADSVTFGSYLYGGIEGANTPSSSGQLLAFNYEDSTAWNRGSQIFIEGENFYYRQFWDNNWKSWRRVISENADGVIDYDLTLGGSLNMPSGLAKIKSGEKSIVESYNDGGDTYIIGENYLYLTTKALFTIKEGQVYGILHEGNYKDYEYSAKNLNVVDTRNTTPKPSDIETFAVTAQFTNADNPKGGWYSGFSVQGWTNDYKAWQLRSGAESSADNHLYFRNGELETWNDWRRVITGDVEGVLDFNLELKGEEGGNIKFVYNSDSAITENKPNDLASIRHALRFPWYGEAYEIGTIRGNAAHSDGFGITHQNNHLVWQVNREQMDVYEDLKVHGNIVVDTDNLSAIDVSHRSSSLWNFALTSFNPIMPDGSLEIIEFGKGQSAYNAGSIGFKYFSDSSPNNMMTISLYNSDEILNITGHRKVGINTTTPRYDLEVNGQMGVYGDLRVNNGLIQYNEEGGYFYLEGNLVVSGGISSYVDVGNLNLPSIYDGLPIDKTTIGWKEVTDASGSKSKVLGIIGDIDDAVMWSDIEGIPSWIGNSKPSYSYSEISGTPNLGEYITSDKLDGYLPLSGGTIDGTLNINVNGTSYECLTAANVNPASNSSVNTRIYTPKEIGNNGQILVVKNQSMGWRNASEIKAGGLTVTKKTAWGQTYWTSSGVPDTIDGDMTNVGSIKPKTNAASDIGGTGAYFRDAYVQRVRMNGGWLSYNASQGYFELDGNLIVTGGITAFADSGAGNQWILDATVLSGVTSTNQYKVYSANVTTMLAKKVASLETKLSAIKTAFNGLSDSSSAAAIVSALKTLASKL